MPELPEIHLLAQAMQDSIVGKIIRKVEVFQPKCLNIPEEEFRCRLAGAKIEAVAPHGKWLKVKTDHGWLMLNLGMGGEVLLTTKDRCPKKLRLLIEFSDQTCLAINFWWFGYAHYTADPAEHPMVGKLGPHALDLSLDEFRALLKGRRGAIKTFLLDQDRIAGIGNVYIQDPLFKARVHPLRPIQTLSDDEVAALWRAIRETLQESIDAGGAPFELNLYGQKGGWSANFLVGYREGKPCPECGTMVVKIKTGSTASYICPGCQPPEPRNRPG